MTEAFNRTALAAVDLLLGWTLALPSDIALLALALASTTVLTGVRVLTTPQPLLRRCAADRRRLRALIREARERGDRRAERRHRDLLGRISTRVLLAGIAPFLVSLPLIAALVTWGFQRLEFRPPREGRPFRIIAVFPATAAGDVAHITPDDKGDLQAEGGWIREITVEPGDAPECAVAEWSLRGAARPEPYAIRIHRGSKTWEYPVRIGARTYPDPVTTPGDGMLSLELGMEEVKLFTVVPGIPALSIPAWLVAYLLLTIPLTLFARRAFRIA